MGCTQAKLYVESLVAGSITKRTLAKDAKPIEKDGAAEPAAAAEIFDAWDALLATHLRPAGAPAGGVRFAAVDYAGLAAADAFPPLLESIASLDPAAVEAWPANSRMALYINAYNALCAEHVCRRLRLGGEAPESVRDCKSEGKEVWDVVAGSIAGAPLSLNQIEHGIIRTKWDEPRVHAVVNCASRSCPDLLGGAYRGDDRLDDQLTAQFTAWMKDETKGLKVENGKATLSRIFLWYAGDFQVKDGALCGQDSGKGTPAAFAATYASGDAKAALLSGAAPAYFDYDWNLNTQ